MSVRRPEVVVAVAIALSLPMLPSFLDGAISPAGLLVRLAIALALCWAVAAVVERVYDNYARQARQAEVRKAMEEVRSRLEAQAPGDERTGASAERRTGADR